MNTLIIDNYDSFTYNLYQYVGELGGNPVVHRNDEITLEEIEQLQPDRIIISPGPGRPDDPEYFGICADAIKTLGKRIPLLGVCLGHQGIFHVFGGTVVRAPQIMHGKTSLVTHSQQGLFKSVPSPLEVMRYHSLIGERSTLPDVLSVTAETADDHIIMAIEHKTSPIYGIQFHPESIGTVDGKVILNNFLFHLDAK
ncbi:MAG: aminodeoxychorismate/anthranilate synthase component II [bacterium]